MKSDCDLFGYNFERSILSMTKKTFFIALCYALFFLILSFIVNLLGKEKSFLWFFIVIIIMYTIPLLSYDARLKLKHVRFYLKYLFR